jgi:hypothetical protein
VEHPDSRSGDGAGTDGVGLEEQLLLLQLRGRGVLDPHAIRILPSPWGQGRHIKGDSVNLPGGKT